MECLFSFAEAHIKDKGDRTSWIKVIEDLLNADQIEQVIKQLEEISKPSHKKTNNAKEKLEAWLSIIKRIKEECSMAPTGRVAISLAPAPLSLPIETSFKKD